MDFFSKEGLLFVVEIDHISGECAGAAISRFYDVGASNVQAISALTKKNRPSYVFLIDCKPQHADAIENVITTELSTGGWHKIQTEHRYIKNQIIPKNIILKHNCQKYDFTAHGKLFDSGCIRPEHDSIEALRNFAKNKLSKNITYTEAYSMISAALLCDSSCEFKI